MPPNRPRVQRDAGELEESLRSQYGFLLRSAAAFDGGAEDEAVRLAVTCRVLLTESGGSSLVRQLGAHKAITLPDTAILSGHVVGPGMRMKLTGTHADGTPFESGDDAPGGLTDPTADGSRWAAPLDGRIGDAKWIKLDPWLSAVAVRSSAGITHSRRDFIRVLANQEGGAHVDPEIEADYAQLRMDTLGFFSVPVVLGPNGEPPAQLDVSKFRAPETNVVEASMRQIAHEAQRALEKHFGAQLNKS